MSFLDEAKDLIGEHSEEIDLAAEVVKSQIGNAMGSDAPTDPAAS